MFKIKDEMVPPEVKAPMSFYGAPEDANGAETEAVLEEILPVPAEEPQVNPYSSVTGSLPVCLCVLLDLTNC